MRESILYRHLTFLKDPKTRSQEYFEKVTYKIPVNQLYQIVDTCYYALSMPYCPILVETFSENGTRSDGF
jgi:hypothetical protein